MHLNLAAGAGVVYVWGQGVEDGAACTASTLQPACASKHVLEERMQHAAQPRQVTGNPRQGEDVRRQSTLHLPCWSQKVHIIYIA